MPVQTSRSLFVAVGETDMIYVRIRVMPSQAPL